MIIEKIGNATLVNADCRDVLPKIKKADCIYLDPPFDVWSDVALPQWDSLFCFTNFQNREAVTNQFGTPRCEVIWHFPDGRWVSNKLPLLCHENILLYGKTQTADVGEAHPKAGLEIKKGKSHIGSDNNLGERRYVAKDRKHITTVFTHPRMCREYLGTWTKPLPLLTPLIEWCAPKTLLDPYMGSAGAAVVCQQLGIAYLGIEVNSENFEIACKRVEDALNQPDLFAPDEVLDAAEMMGGTL